MSVHDYRKCSKCGLTRNQDRSITYHRFPNPGTTNTFKALAWAKYCWPNQEWKSVESLRKLCIANKVLCGRHFGSSQFYDNERKKLSKFAVPGSEVKKFLKTLQDQIAEMTADDTALSVPKDQPSTSETVKLSCVDDSKRSQLISLQNPTPVVVSQDQPSTLAGLHPTPCNIGQNITSLETSTSQRGSKNKRRGILKDLDVNSLKDFNPRERKMYLKCRIYLKELSRLRIKCKSLKKSHVLNKVCDSDSLNNLLRMNISSSFVLLLQSQLTNCGRKLKGRRWTLDQKIIALGLFKKSPACYRLLRRLYCFPSQSTLNKLLNRVPLRTGVNEQVHASLKNMAENQTSDENVCTIMVDEMSLRKHLQYNEKLDLIEGYQDHGKHGRTREVVSNALVFMIAGIRKKFKQPIAHYFSGKSVTADRLAVIIKEVLEECFKTGLHIVATVCDLSRVNIRALDLLGSTTDRPYFDYKGQEIVTILDPPHLMKCTRNLFMKYDAECLPEVQCEGKTLKGIAKWNHIRSFYEMDKNNPNFVYAPTLTEQHLNPNTKQKMRVCLATQVFSHSVAAGILSKVASNELPSAAATTATLLSKFDQLFDALNADTPDLRRGKKYSTNLTARSPHLEYFKEMKILFENLKIIGSQNNAPSQKGWIRTINAIERLWRHLSITYRIRSICTRRLNQDPLENCFGCIRYSCGSNPNPTVGQFVAGLKTAIMNNLRNSSKRRNCEDDTGVLVHNFRKFLSTLPQAEENVGSSTSTIMPLLQMDDDLANAIEVNISEATSEAQACAYVCGFILKNYKTDCSICKNLLFAQNFTNLHTFIDFKEYDSIKRSLVYCNENVVRYVEQCATIINNYLKNESQQEAAKEKLFNILKESVNTNFLMPCGAHLVQNINYILAYVIKICFKRFCTLENRKFVDDISKSLQSKIKNLQHV